VDVLRAIRGLRMMTALLMIGAGGCTQIDRSMAVPAHETTRATVMGIANVRYYGSDTAGLIAEFQRAFEREDRYFKSIGKPLPAASYLAISGGGDNGAFGAGLMVGARHAADLQGRVGREHRRADRAVRLSRTRLRRSAG
jgi:hypothetical protein